MLAVEMPATGTLTESAGTHSYSLSHELTSHDEYSKLYPPTLTETGYANPHLKYCGSCD